MNNMKRLTALLLALMMIFGTLAAAAEGFDLDKITWDDWQQIVEDAKNELNTPVINPGGTNINTPEFPYTNKLNEGRYLAKLDANLTDGTVEMTTSDLVTVASANAAQWQIRVGEELWVNVGGVSNTLVVNYAMLANSLKQIRQADNTDVVLTFNVTTAVLPQNDTPTLASIAREGEGNTNLGEHDVNTTYNIVINYKFENNEIVSDPYTANLAAGSSFSATVKFPTVQGYLPYVDETQQQQNSMELNYSSVSEDVTINVVYKPTNVAYTVIYYQQNVDNDQYTEVERETKQGLTGSQVPDVHKKYDGFYNLLYEKPAIAADGSTVIEVYYDRYYYLMNFDMDGGYGTDPVYARYGAEIGKVTQPELAGYTFLGWAETKGETTEDKAVTLPTTMPAASKTYYAIWKVGDSAKVAVVFWGENANDEGYSYLADETEKFGTLYLKPGESFTYTEADMLICTKEVHTHGESCIGCRKAEHTHTAYDAHDGCYTLTCTVENHTHGVNCFDGVGSSTKIYTLQISPSTGDVVKKHAIVSDDKAIYIDGTWYDYTGTTGAGNKATATCGKTEGTHVHGAGCYELTCTKEVHSHNDECYTCGKEAHQHNSGCYKQGAGLDANLWKFVSSDTVTVAADGSTVVNVKFDRVEKTLTFNYSYNNRNGYQKQEKIKAKWGENIATKYNAIVTNAGSSFWSEIYDYDGPYTNYIGVMPQTDKTYYYRRDSGSNGTMYYYGEDLNGNYVEMFKVEKVGGYTVTKEDHYEFEGYTYDHGTSNGSSCSGAKFYYTRNSYELTFNDQYNDVKNETVKFEAPLSTYKDYVPEVPSAYEPGSVEFGGWYQNPQCTGEEYKLDEHKMPANDIILYAKWVPVNRTVEFYLTESSTETYPKDKSTYPTKDKADEYGGTYYDAENDKIIVPHGGNIAQFYVNANLTKDAMNEAKPNGDYTFVMWYYYEDGEKTPFDPTTQIRKDLTLYGEWSSNTLKQYTVQYVLKDDHSVKVADDLTGSDLAGTTKTFDAKGGTELYAVYQEGYFPTVQSQSLLLDIDKETLTITFEYVPMPAVPYTVKYVEKDTGKSLAEDKVVSDNRKAVVTETFKPISGYMPDAYQKRLVVTAGGENILYFYYTKDTQHAYYKITHYTQNTDGVTWSEYASSQAVGDIGTRYTASPMTIPGYNYDHIEYVVSKVKVMDVTDEGAKLTENGLEINLYYDRIEYPFEFKFLEQGTDKVLADATTGNARYQAQVTEKAKTIDGYKLVSDENQVITIAIEDPTNVAKNNVKIFYYQEETIEIKYEVVGPDGCGTLSSYADSNVKVFTGSVNGSTPTAGDGFKFIGWFKDADCTQPVEGENWLNGDQIVPQKTEAITVNDEEELAYKAATYYAKFVVDKAKLTIEKNGMEAGESAIFNVVGPGYNGQVVVPGNGGSVTLYVTCGEYTITEVDAWSNRYTHTVSGLESDKVTVSAGGAMVTFTNTKKNDQWLHDESSVKNVFETTKGGENE